MKASEFSKCAVCGQGMMASGNLTFLRISIEQLVINPAEVQRAAGLEMAMGPLAAVLGPDADLAKPVANEAGLVCQDCALTRPIAPFSLFEQMVEAADRKPDGAKP